MIASGKNPLGKVLEVIDQMNSSIGTEGLCMVIMVHDNIGILFFVHTGIYIKVYIKRKLINFPCWPL